MKKIDRINFRLDPDLRAALQAYTRREDRFEAEVIREALWQYLEARGYGPGGKGRRQKTITV